MGKGKAAASEPLHKTAKDAPGISKRAVESSIDDIFANPKPFADIEIIYQDKDKEGDEG